MPKYRSSDSPSGRSAGTTRDECTIGVASWVILKGVDAAIGLRVTDEDENQGLDLALHDEVGYRQ